jgi:hypothetical protein
MSQKVSAKVAFINLNDRIVKQKNYIKYLEEQLKQRNYDCKKLLDENNELKQSDSIFNGNDVIRNDVVSNDVVRNEVVSNDVMRNDVVCNDVVCNDVVCNDVMRNDVISNDVISNDVVSNDVIDTPFYEENKNNEILLKVTEVNKETSLENSIFNFNDINSLKGLTLGHLIKCKLAK